MVLLGGLNYRVPTPEQGSDLVELRIEVFGNAHKELYNASGVTLEQLLRVKHNITYSGRLKCLDSVCDSGDYYWHIFVNGKPANMGIKAYTIKPGDKITLRFTG